MEESDRAVFEAQMARLRSFDVQIAAQERKIDEASAVIDRLREKRRRLVAMMKHGPDFPAAPEEIER